MSNHATSRPNEPGGPCFVAAGADRTCRPAPRRPLRRILPWAIYAAIAIAAAAASTAALPLWFRDDDAGFLLFARQHGFWEAFSPEHGAVQTFYRPVFVGAFWLAYRAFGLNYAPYQAIQVLATFGIWAAFYLMLRALWDSRPAALVATILHALLFSKFYYFTFRFSQLNYQLELLLGFTAVAVGAWGWRRQCPWRLAAALILTELTYLAKEPACLYVPILQAWAAVVLGRRAGAGIRRIALFLACVAGVTIAHLWLVRSHFRLLTVGGQIETDAAFVWTRLRYYADILQAGLSGDLLALAIGLAAGCRCYVFRVPRRTGVIGAIAAGAAAAALAKWVHPLLPILALSVPVPAAWPFAAGAVVLVAAIAQLEPIWTLYVMQATWLMTAAAVIVMAKSPLARRAGLLLASRWGERRGRILIAASVAALACGGLVAGLAGSQVAALKVTSDRRLLARDLTLDHVLRLPRGAVVAVPVWEDLGLTARQIHDLPALPRSRILLQWPGKLYGQLLDACGRNDLRVTHYADVNSLPVYLPVTSPAEHDAAMRLAVRLAECGATPPRKLAETVRGEETGELWVVAPGSDESPPPAK